MPSTELITEKKLEQPCAWVVHSKTGQSVNSPQTEILRFFGEQPVERVMAHNQGFANNPDKAREAGRKEASTATRTSAGSSPHRIAIATRADRTAPSVAERATLPMPASARRKRVARAARTKSAS